MSSDEATMWQVEGLRVLIVEDSMFIREGLARVLTASGVLVVGTAQEPVQAMLDIGRSRPDVVVMDVGMRPSYTNEGILAAEQIRVNHPGVGILMLAQDVEMCHVEPLLQRHQRAIGCLLEERVTDCAQLAAALHRVAAGGTAVDAAVVQLLARARHSNRHADPLGVLTDRELTVLAMMAKGLTNAAIADRMAVGARTVESHVKAVFDKLGFRPGATEHRRVLAVLEYVRGGSDTSLLSARARPQEDTG